MALKFEAYEENLEIIYYYYVKEEAKKRIKNNNKKLFKQQKNECKYKTPEVSGGNESI